MPTRNHIDLVEKNMRVLEALAETEEEIALKDLVERVELVKSSVFRILFTLKELGYVEQTEGGGYRPALKMFALARSGRQRLDIPTLARPHLDRLRDTLGESAFLAERRGTNVLLVACAEGSYALRLNLRIGDRCPLHASALGKAIAAYMPPAEVSAALGVAVLQAFTPKTITSRAQLDCEFETIRRLGYAVNEEESIEGAFLVGAPVFDAMQTACAAISSSAPVARCEGSKRRNMIAAVREAAAGVSADLASIGFECPDRHRVPS